jgi:hypothetical protein
MGDGTIMHQCDINVALAEELRRKKSLTSTYTVFNIRPSYGKSLLSKSIAYTYPARTNAFPIASQWVKLRRCVKRG